MSAGLRLLEELVAIPSHASEREGVRAVSHVVVRQLRALGFEEIGAHVPHRRVPPWAEELLSPEATFEQLVDPVVLRRPGTVPGTLLLLGDLDTSLLAAQPSLTVAGGRAIGPGVADMKGGLVVMIEALRTLGTSPSPSVTIVLSGDEQAGSLRSAATIAAHARTATWCMCFECGRDGGRVMTSRACVGVGRAVARTAAAYAGTARSGSDNAAVLLGRIIVAIAEVGGDQFRCTPTILRAGRRRSLIPDEALAVLDLRAVDDAAWDTLARELRILPREVAMADAVTIETASHRAALPRTSLTERFFELVRDVGSRLGVGVEETPSLAAGSSAFVDSNRVFVLDGMGPSGGELMTDREFIEISTLEERARLVAATIARLGASTSTA
jgi:glutamate carboxypeptidase